MINNDSHQNLKDPSNDFLNEINPYIRRAWYSVMPPKDIVHERILYDYELMLVKSGTAHVTIEGQHYEATDGDIFLFKPGQLHSIKTYDKPLVQPHIHFDLIYSPQDSTNTPISFKKLHEMSDKERRQIRPDIITQIFGDIPSYIKTPNSLYIEQLMFDVINSYHTSDSLSKIHLKWCFLRLFEHLLYEIDMQSTKRNLSKEELANSVKQYIDHHDNRQISLDELAKSFNFDKSYISRVFNDIFKQSPIKYHLFQRIDKAKNMLCYTNLSISSISERCGFSSPQDFSRAFSRLTGTLPSVYRKNMPVHKMYQGGGAPL